MLLSRRINTRRGIMHPGGRIEVVTGRIYRPDDGEVLIRMEDSAGCGGDTSKAGGDDVQEAPEYFGHEGFGTIVEVRRRRRRKEQYRRDNPYGVRLRPVEVGDRVTFSLPDAGGMADYVVTQADLCTVVPDGPELKYWSLWGEPTSCMVGAVDELDVKLGQDVFMVGLGFMGTVGLQMLNASSTGRIIVGVRSEQAEKTAWEFGATKVVRLDPGRELDSVEDEVRAICGGELPQRCLEVTGAGAGLRLAERLVRVHGRVVIAGYHTSQDTSPGGEKMPHGKRWNDEKDADFKGITTVRGHFRDLDRIMRNMAAGHALVRDGHIYTPSIEQRVTEVPLEQAALQDVFDRATGKKKGDKPWKIVVRPGLS
jgi:L-iditol 2-dehydrogenase